MLTHSSLTRVLKPAATLFLAVLSIQHLNGDEFVINGHKFTLPNGLTVEHIAGSPLVDRPVSADFDEHGRLYVTDSSGSNEPVKVQQEKRPHRIMRLVDSNGDGRFDKSTVYADKLMFPEGAQWFDGSLYVAAPPEIWKFTDRDDDGVAEEREVWFDGKTLTHCANDLHGPYLGPDGWMYWCKGAFAEQTHEQPGKAALTTSAAHIFRRRPEGGPVDIVMTGGMDNPVEVVFTPGGERIFTTTFLVHPNQGQRDGLIHAVYGGVYGKDHGVLKGHPRTGELMPVLSHLGAAAPCGLARLESAALGEGYQNTVMACSFNMHKIIRHSLTKHGASFKAELSDLIVSDNLDFHPTDVLEDADGSLIVVDTGGWFKLCCPTSQLEKADVLGGIYRIRKADHQSVKDPRGKQIAWDKISDKDLVQLLQDPRHSVRNLARRRIVKRGAATVQPLKLAISSDDANFRREVVWALTGIQDAAAAPIIRHAMVDADETVRQAALHSVSVRRDKSAVPKLLSVIRQESAHNRRAAAEALGRIGLSDHIVNLLSAIPTAKLEDGTVDRALEHSLIYAAIELGDSEALRPLIESPDESIKRAALIALDQLPLDEHLAASDIQPLLISNNERLNETAWWIAEQHPDWSTAVAAALHKSITNPPSDTSKLKRLGRRLRKFAGSTDVQKSIAAGLGLHAQRADLQTFLLGVMADSQQKPMPELWAAPVTKCLSGPPETKRAALTVLNQLSGKKVSGETLAVLSRLASDQQQSPEIRLRALNLLPPESRQKTARALDFVCSQLNVENEVTNRSLAVDFVKETPLNSAQLQRVAQELPVTGPLELKPILTVFAKSKDPQVGTVLVDSLMKSPAATSLFPDRLNDLISGYGDSVRTQGADLLKKVEQENRNKLERVEAVLALLPKADVRRGLKVFQSTKASCLACHRRGYIGGSIGPDLNRIGKVRSERDLLESILFPSLSFVRSYEPQTIVTTDGKTYGGLVRDETENQLTVQLDASKSVRLQKADIEERLPSKVSIMPAGLEKQLTPQDLADLVKYLKEG